MKTKLNMYNVYINKANRFVLQSLLIGKQIELLRTHLKGYCLENSVATLQAKQSRCNKLASLYHTAASRCLREHESRQSEAKKARRILKKRDKLARKQFELAQAA